MIDPRYIGGVVDSSLSMTICEKKDRKGYKFHVLTITLSFLEKEMVILMKKYFNCGCIYKSLSRERNTQTFRISFSSRKDLIIFYEKSFEHVIVRNEEYTIIDFWIRNCLNEKNFPLSHIIFENRVLCQEMLKNHKLKKYGYNRKGGLKAIS